MSSSTMVTSATALSSIPDMMVEDGRLGDSTDDVIHRVHEASDLGLDEDKPRTETDAFLLEEEQKDILRTFAILTLATRHLENEDELQKQEDEDMNKTFEILSNVLSSSELRFLRQSHQCKYVQFNPDVQVAMLPFEERMEARYARQKYWEPGPLHDEIWDGDNGVFRDIELTPEELALLNKRKSRVVGKIRSYFMTKVVNIDARSHARRMKFDEDDEEEEGGSTNNRGSNSMKTKRKSSARFLKFLARRSTTKKDEQVSREWLNMVLDEGQRTESDSDIAANPSNDTE